MNKISIVLLILAGVFLCNKSIAQDVSFEKIKSICPDNIPREDKITLTVVRFSNRTRNRSGELGKELATILTNSLFSVNCFRVLESASNVDVFDQEYNLNNSGYGSKDQKGNMLAAQVIVTGEITEYSEGNKGISVLGATVGQNIAHVGFVLKVLDPVSRDVLFSKSIDMKSKANGFHGLSLGRYFKLVGSENRSKAMNDAVEKAIIKASEVLAKSKDEWGISASSSEITASGNKNIRVQVQNVDYRTIIDVQKKIESLSGVDNVSKQFSNNIGIYNTSFIGSVDDLAMLIIENIGSDFEILQVNENSGILIRKK